VAQSLLEVCGQVLLILDPNGKANEVVRNAICKRTVAGGSIRDSTPPSDSARMKTRTPSSGSSGRKSASRWARRRKENVPRSRSSDVVLARVADDSQVLDAARGGPSGDFPASARWRERCDCVPPCGWPGLDAAEESPITSLPTNCRYPAQRCLPCGPGSPKTASLR